MELLLILLYVSICYVVFKVFKIPVTQWPLATAALGGIIGITALLLIMNYNHPFTTNARIYFAVTPVLPTVRGRVIEVPVQTNAPLKEGDVLFRIDPKPYEFVVDQKKAALAEAEQNVKQLKASLDQTTAAAERASAQFEQGAAELRPTGRVPRHFSKHLRALMRHLGIHRQPCQLACLVAPTDLAVFADILIHSVSADRPEPKL